MTTTEVRLVHVMNEGAVVLWWGGSTRSTRVTTWGAGRLRKQRSCAVTGRLMSVGEMAFRPITNVDYRMERIDSTVVLAAITEEGE